MVQQLKYGNTNTFYISNGHGGILVDTDWAWTLSAFYKTIKSQDIKIAYNENDTLRNSWNKILSYDLKVVFYGHANERDVSRLSSVDDL